MLGRNLSLPLLFPTNSGTMISLRYTSWLGNLMHDRNPRYWFMNSFCYRMIPTKTSSDVYQAHYESEPHAQPRTAGESLDVDRKQHDCTKIASQLIEAQSRCSSIGMKTYKWVIIWTFLSFASFLTSTRNNWTCSVDHPSTLVKSSSVNPSIPSRSWRRWKYPTSFCGQVGRSVQSYPWRYQQLHKETCVPVLGPLAKVPRESERYVPEHWRIQPVQPVVWVPGRFAKIFQSIRRLRWEDHG